MTVNPKIQVFHEYLNDALSTSPPLKASPGFGNGTSKATRTLLWSVVLSRVIGQRPSSATQSAQIPNCLETKLRLYIGKMIDNTISYILIQKSVRYLAVGQYIIWKHFTCKIWSPPLILSSRAAMLYGSICKLINNICSEELRDKNI